MPGLNQSAVILGTESSDRSSLNEEYTIHSNFSTPQAQNQPLIIFPQTYPQKNIMVISLRNFHWNPNSFSQESFNSPSPDYGMAQPYPNLQAAQSNNLNVMNIFKGFGIQNTGLVSYHSDATTGVQIKSGGKNSQRIPEEEQNSEVYEIDIDKVIPSFLIMSADVSLG